MMSDCDVLVVGAGSAGIPAALTAARLGARTLLVERSSRIGGAGVWAMHRWMAGIYGDAPAGIADTLNDGLQRTVAERIAADANLTTPVALGRLHVLPCSEERLHRVYRGLLDETAGLAVCLHCEVKSARLEGDEVAALTLRMQEEVLETAPRVVIDATGDGALLAMTAAPTLLTPDVQRQMAGFLVRVCGVRGADDDAAVRVAAALSRMAERAGAPACLRYTTFTPGEDSAEGYLKFALPAATPQRLETARRNALLAHEELAARVSAFADSWLDWARPLVVVDREGPRLRGDYVLTGEDVLGGRKFGGGVRNAWPIELWTEANGPTYRELPPGMVYEIPIACQTSAARPNLLCAGRNISATHEALGSTRPMGTCIALGEAAGREAVKRLR